MEEFAHDKTLQTVEFFVRGKYVIVCATKKKCLVAIYSTDKIPNRVVNVGFDMISDSFIIAGTKLFGVSHPQKKILAFFELDENPCSRDFVKKCDPFYLGTNLECK